MVGKMGKRKMGMRGCGDEEAGECGEGDMGRKPSMFRVFGECSQTAPNTPEHLSIVTNEGTMPGDIKWDMQHYLYSPSPSPPPLLFPLF
jgi:hypothetical protein